MRLRYEVLYFSQLIDMQAQCTEDVSALVDEVEQVDNALSTSVEQHHHVMKDKETKYHELLGTVSHSYHMLEIANNSMGVIGNNIYIPFF